ncbi:cell envelope integrity protein CreD [Photobacterium nomapromontoriensis]|uniref:cell envelope integrity protein CreD n=1 Tax=Photobacterium nomapromontoriensis TaxID=2910237 RepID=UPI003D101393
MKTIFNNQIAIKFGFVLFLFVLLQIPLSMVSDLISERSHRQQEVQDDIARSSSDKQRIIGPFLSVDYIEMVTNEDKTYAMKRQAFILPDTFDLTAHLESFEKYRGIYQARLYKAKTALKGSFDLSALSELRQFDIQDVNMVVGISDSRGLIKLDNMTLGGKAIDVIPGTGINQLAQGFRTRLDTNQLNASTMLPFDLNFLLQGMGQLQVTPIGKNTTVELSSEWPHPSFIGDYLPISSDISDAGFNAQWASNNFSTNMTQLFGNCMSDSSSCYEFERRQMGVDLIDPVDHYLKSHRAINYSLLVITLVFASFFLLEMLQARMMHPIQYGFVGLALALFYLLLISLSEHVGFNWAYVISALASTVLLSVYVGGMLKSKKNGLIFGGSLLGLYGLLFGLLLAESYALLMGTLLCFAILSLVMVLTRDVDWYERSCKSLESNDEVIRHEQQQA